MPRWWSMIKPSRPGRIPLEVFKVDYECEKIMIEVVVRCVERGYEFIDVCVRHQVWKTQFLWKRLAIDCAINSAKDVMNEENLYILVFFGGVYQSRQMKIEARVGEQNQLGQKCVVVRRRIIYPVRGTGIVARKPVAEWLFAQTEPQDTFVSVYLIR